MVKYTHTELDKDCYAISGFYCPQKEVRLMLGEREVLYVAGQADVSTCCGAGQWQYVIVPGYVLSWQTQKNADGLLVTEVEPVTDKESVSEIRRIIKEREGVTQVDFW